MAFCILASSSGLLHFTRRVAQIQLNRVSLECSLRHCTRRNCGNRCTSWQHRRVTSRRLAPICCDINEEHHSGGAAVSAPPQRQRGSGALHKQMRRQAMLSQRWLLVISTISSVFSKGKKLLRSGVESLITRSPVDLSEPACAPGFCLVFKPLFAEWLLSFRVVKDGAHEQRFFFSSPYR